LSDWHLVDTLAENSRCLFSRNLLRILSAWNNLNRQIVACKRCPRLLDWCRQVAEEKRRAYRDSDYWGKPVPNFGDAKARLLVVGLAPAAHGGNRTGRMFTGDRSGDWLYRALFKAGFANQPISTDREDGLELLDCAITAVCHCAPPDNKPLPAEIADCRGWLQETIDLCRVQVFVALGQIAWRAVIDEARRRKWWHGKIPAFGHASVVSIGERRILIGSYHPSQQNTFTGRLTEPMLDRVFELAREHLASTKTKRHRARK
jgi:uracil-DNA glycosylase family 4